MNKQLINKIFIITGLLAAILFPIAGTSNFMKDLFIHTCMVAYLALAWNILSGFAGQFSFGSALYYGIGGYTSTILFMNYGISPWIGIFIGALLAAVIATCEGFLFFRFNLQGAYFALGTLAFSYVFLVLAGNIEIFGKNVGLLIPLSNSFSDYQFSTREPYAYIILTMLIVLILFTKWIQNSSMMYKFAAIRQNELSANALGINPFKYKMIAIVISAFFTALGGSFYAQWQLFIDPSLMFADTISVMILLPAVIGGVGTLGGPILGAVALTVFNEISSSLFGKITGMNLFIYGAILVLITIFAPKGLIGIYDRLLDRINFKSKKQDNGLFKGDDLNVNTASQKSL